MHNDLNLFGYKGYQATIELNPDYENNLSPENLKGQIRFENNICSFYGKTIDEMIENFHLVVDDHLIDKKRQWIKTADLPNPEKIHAEHSKHNIKSDPPEDFPRHFNCRSAFFPNQTQKPQNQINKDVLIKLITIKAMVAGIDNDWQGMEQEDLIVVSNILESIKDVLNK